MSSGEKRKKKILVGWREWVGLPGLGVDRIKAKVDTGARTSAIHAYGVTPFERDGREWVHFRLHPVQKRKRPEIECEAPVVEERWITSSNGQRQKRYVIETDITIGRETWAIELTLTNRDPLGFRMLLGRQAVRGHCSVDPGASYLMAEPQNGNATRIRDFQWKRKGTG